MQPTCACSKGVGIASFGLETVKELVAGWPYVNAAIRNAEMALAKADLDIAAGRVKQYESVDDMLADLDS